MSCCKTCLQASKIAGKMATKRKKAAGGGILDIFLGAAAVAGGAIIANLATNNTFVGSNPMLKAALPLAGAVAVPMFLGGGGVATGVATGMATYGILSLANQVAPGLTPALSGGSSQWKTNFNPGVAAAPGRSPQVVL